MPTLLKHLILTLFLLGSTHAALAQFPGTDSSSSPGNSPLVGGDDEEFLPVHDAFRLMDSTDGSHIHLRFEIADGYYLYQHRFQFNLSEGSSGEIGEAVYVQNPTWKDDPIFGRVKVFYSEVDIYVPVLQGDGGFIELDSTYQGCAEKGLCYIPQTHTNLYQVDTEAAPPAAATEAKPATTSELPAETAPESKPTSAALQTTQSDSHTDLFPDITSSTSTDTSADAVDTDDALSLERFLDRGNLFTILGVFFLVGIGLTFTPCVLPMIPILSGIIVGQGPELTRHKAAILSLTYVLGMAFTYAALGVVAGLTGAKLQVAMQTPWVLFSFALVFLLLSLSMFGFYELQLPSALQNRLNAVSQRQRGGTYLGVGIIGVLSALLVSPCVSAPLAGALLYIGQSGDWLLGGGALLALGLGMGVPLLIIGISGANILPKAGGWMDNVKGLFGVLLLAVALWLIKHLLPATLVWSGAGGLMILAALYLGALDPLTSPRSKLFKALGLSLLIAGAGLILGAVMKPLLPAAALAGFASEAAAPLPFQRVRSESELTALLQQAQRSAQPVILDYYADWCTACLEMEHETFSQTDVQKRLQRYRWVQIDLTDNPQDQALLDRFQLPGPPAILFFNGNGEELPEARIYAYKSKARFMQHLDAHRL